jgi:hypothetical protein
MEMRSTWRLFYALVFLGLGCAALFLAKPKFAFRPDGSLYDFGTGHDKSVFSLGVCVAAIAIVSLFLLGVVDLVGGSPSPPYRQLPLYSPAPVPSPAYVVRPASGGSNKIDVFDPDHQVF